MKKIYTLIITATLSLSCKAQNQTLDLSQKNGWDSITGAYYKDTNNQLNPFEGTYIYTNGSTSFKIVLQKKTMSSNSRYYEDLIIGEYQFIENGVEKANTLNKFNINYTNKRNHSIDGNLIITQGQTGCSECLPNEKALRISLTDGATRNASLLTVRRVNVNGQPAISIYIMWEMRYEGGPQNSSFPGGDYTLIKQL